MVGKIHSIESFGTVDGPGVRMVIFMKGCPLRCLYCHNPDTWSVGDEIAISSDELIAQFQSNRSFYQTGGITVSGGEPLLQREFVTELFEKAKKFHIHTCLDTSGASYSDSPAITNSIDRLLSVTDLVLLDIKHINPDEHKKLCGQDNQKILDFARHLDQLQIPVWIRHVVVPKLTDDEVWLYQLGLFIGTLKNVKALDVLPYHDMGKQKYKALGIEYPLENTPPLSKEEAIRAKKIILNGIHDKRMTISDKSC